jgi:hypothetical protein
MRSVDPDRTTKRRSLIPVPLATRRSTARTRIGKERADPPRKRGSPYPKYGADCPGSAPLRGKILAAATASTVDVQCDRQPTPAFNKLLSLEPSFFDHRNHYRARAREAALLQGPGDAYKAYARASNKPVPTLVLLLSNASTRGFSNANLDRVDLLPASDPGQGLVISMRFAGIAATEVRVAGRNLDGLYTYLGCHRIPCVRAGASGVARVSPGGGDGDYRDHGDAAAIGLRGQLNLISQKGNHPLGHGFPEAE